MEPDLFSELGINPEDVKVDNSDPSKEFAVNVDVNLCELALLSRDEAIDAVTGTDDYERPVTVVPLEETSCKLDVDCIDGMVEIGDAESPLPLGEMLWRVARALPVFYTDARPSGMRRPSVPLQQLHAARLCWLRGGIAWSLTLSAPCWEGADRPTEAEFGLPPELEVPRPAPPGDARQRLQELEARHGVALPES